MEQRRLEMLDFIFYHKLMSRDCDSGSNFHSPVWQPYTTFASRKSVYSSTVYYCSTLDLKYLLILSPYLKSTALQIFQLFHIATGKLDS